MQSGIVDPFEPEQGGATPWQIATRGVEKSVAERLRHADAAVVRR
jgi:hypothetical protein